MIEGNFVITPALLLAGVVGVLGLRAGRPPWTILVTLAAIGHLAVLVAVTLFPLPVQDEVIEHGRQLQLATNNFVPLRTIVDAAASGQHPSVVHQSLGNLVLLAPLGVYAPLLWSRFRSWAFMLALGVGVSLGIEGLQLLISGLLGYTYKIVDVDDVILNSIGVVGGYLGYRIIERLGRFMAMESCDGDS